MDYKDFQIVLASIDPPSVFNFYPTKEAAEADKARANTREYSLGYPYTHVMTLDEYRAAERAQYLARPVEEITEEQHMRMFEVLPPKAIYSTAGYFSFLCSEHWSGPWTSQYVRIGDGETARYFTKLVHAADRATWMTRDSLTEQLQGAK